ncbi:conserved hypothetical protein [Bacillus altitudinis]|uniref:Uncharacterized protein n=1 Tax=Bacillus altitudinis TaxID=293387 RepID=A0A653XN78_BACAB|nr:hypothetical protein B4133_3630 [Bacillus altitudinis]PYH27882.1 hypothetical protein US8_00505 [Bacillus altitudinis]VXC18211.1 conserved hypothetical protein [Bacillus altitudinis]VXC31401.1 conserved hypothetical protein [Bacillus altitudinis]
MKKGELTPTDFDSITKGRKVFEGRWLFTIIQQFIHYLRKDGDLLVQSH